MLHRAFLYLTFWWVRTLSAALTVPPQCLDVTTRKKTWLCIKLQHVKIQTNVGAVYNCKLCKLQYCLVMTTKVWRLHIWFSGRFTGKRLFFFCLFFFFYCQIISRPSLLYIVLYFLSHQGEKNEHKRFDWVITAFAYWTLVCFVNMTRKTWQRVNKRTRTE